MNTVRFFVFLSSFLLFSCTKNNEGIDSKLAEIGDYSGMDVNTYDTIINLGYNFIPFNFDIDNDDINDFRISYADSVIRNNEGFMAGVIECLDQNMYLSTIHTVDTTYFSRRTQTTLVNRVHISIYSTYQCANTEGFSISETETNIHLKPYYPEENISPNDFWQYGKFVFGNLRDEPSSTYSDVVTTDTIWIRYKVSFLDCYFLPVNQDIYIGIKKVRGLHSRYGWIKLRLNKGAGT